MGRRAASPSKDTERTPGETGAGDQDNSSLSLENALNRKRAASLARTNKCIAGAPRAAPESPCPVWLRGCGC